VKRTPESADAYDDPFLTASLAQIYAWVGEKDQALQLVDHSLPEWSHSLDVETGPDVGPAAWRPALRENRRLARAEKTVKLNQAVLRKGAMFDIT
jgi:hypothetical protein